MTDLKETIKERRKLVDDFDKIVFTSATVFLTLSISAASIGELKIVEGYSKYLLSISWAMFSGVIVFHIISYLLAEFSYHRRESLCKEGKKEDVIDSDSTVGWLQNISVALDYASIASVLIGVLLFTIFGIKLIF